MVVQECFNDPSRLFKGPFSDVSWVFVFKQSSCFNGVSRFQRCFQTVLRVFPGFMGEGPSIEIAHVSVSKG